MPGQLVALVVLVVVVLDSHLLAVTALVSGRAGVRCCDDNYRVGANISDNYKQLTKLSISG